MWISSDIRGESFLSTLTSSGLLLRLPASRFRVAALALSARGSILRPFTLDTRVTQPPSAVSSAAENLTVETYHATSPSASALWLLVLVQPNTQYQEPNASLHTRPSAGHYSIGLKIFFEDFFKVPFGNSSFRIEPRRFCLGGD
jgi:hypothetical protein